MNKEFRVGMRLKCINDELLYHTLGKIYKINKIINRCDYQEIYYWDDRENGFIESTNVKEYFRIINDFKIKIKFVKELL